MKVRNNLMKVFSPFIFHHNNRNLRFSHRYHKLKVCSLIFSFHISVIKVTGWTNGVRLPEGTGIFLFANTSYRCTFPGVNAAEVRSAEVKMRDIPPLFHMSLGRGS
jgi:hypothetical protein